MIMYDVTKVFVTGVLKGRELTERTTVKFVEGRTYKACVGSSKYKVIKVEQVDVDNQGMTAIERKAVRRELTKSGISNVADVIGL